jgi:hypothetical protein
MPLDTQALQNTEVDSAHAPLAASCAAKRKRRAKATMLSPPLACSTLFTIHPLLIQMICPPLH